MHARAISHLPVDLLDLAAQVAAGEPLGLVNLGHLIGILVHHLQVPLQPRTAVLRALRQISCSFMILLQLLLLRCYSCRTTQGALVRKLQAAIYPIAGLARPKQDPLHCRRNASYIHQPLLMGGSRYAGRATQCMHHVEKV